MRVHIGKHVDWIGPFQIASILCFWAKDKNGDEPHWVHEFGTWLATDKNGDDSWLMKFCEKFHNRKKRKIDIHIDGYDTWNADHTLAMIILPILIRLQREKHGAPFTDDSDAPIWLHSTLKPPTEEWGTDGNHFARWDWIMEEMIWAFNEKAYGDDGKFYDHGEKVKGESIEEQCKKIKIDKVGLDNYHKRMQNGFRLFGKYYQNLWD
jgi:hypothetical protein